MQQHAYSVPELLFTLLLIAILLALGIPGIGWLALDTRMTADINALVTSIQLARSESAKQGKPAVVCKTADFWRCGGDDVHYESGWMVFVNADGDNPPVRDAGEALIFRYSPSLEGSIRSNRASYVFRPYYRRSTNGTITFCDRRGSEAARAVIVSYTGRPRVSGEGPGARRLACAG